MFPAQRDKDALFCPGGMRGAIHGAETQERARLETFLAGSERGNCEPVFVSEIALKVWSVWTSVSQT